MDFCILGHTVFQWLILGIAALVIGFSKTGMPGMGTLVVPLVAFVLPAKASTGMILPMLIVGDIFAVSFYRRHADWRHLMHLLPWSFVGIVLGYFALMLVTDAQLKPLMGIMILALLTIDFIRRLLPSKAASADDPPKPKRPKAHAAFAGVMGTLAGCMTMMANAAGAIVSIYMIMMRLPKAVFVGTAAWYFLIVNCTKVPFSAHLGLVTKESLILNLLMAPLIVVGALLGVKALKRMPENLFRLLVQILTALAALKLIF